MEIMRLEFHSNKYILIRSRNKLINKIMKIKIILIIKIIISFNLFMVFKNYYRPIALTSSLCKTFEQIIVKQILKYTESIWRDNKQYGFLPGRNTMDALIQVIEDWNKVTDEGKTTHAVFFDFKKAFDLINHIILLLKLDKFLPKWLTAWIAQYLTGRKQRLKSNNQSSDWLDVEAGVIQGSVLGPILFIIFITDINSYIPPSIQLTKYAYDLSYNDYNVYNDYKDTKDDNTQLAIDGVEKWAKDNNMQINTNKTKHMILNQQENKINILNQIFIR